MTTVLLLTLTLILWGTSPILEKIGLANIDPLTAVTIRSMAITAVLLLFVALTGRIKYLAQIDARTVAIFSVSGIMAGFLGMWTYFGALKLEPASKIVPIVAAYPLVTAILGIIILKEGITIFRLIGTILIIAGIWLVK